MSVSKLCTKMDPFSTKDALPDKWEPLLRRRKLLIVPYVPYFNYFEIYFLPHRIRNIHIAFGRG